MLKSLIEQYERDTVGHVVKWVNRYYNGRVLAGTVYAVIVDADNVYLCVVDMRNNTYLISPLWTV